MIGIDFKFFLKYQERKGVGVGKERKKGERRRRGKRRRERENRFMVTERN